MKNLISNWQFNSTNTYGSESKERDTINEWFERSTISNTDLLKQRFNEKKSSPPKPRSLLCSNSTIKVVIPWFQQICHLKKQVQNEESVFWNPHLFTAVIETSDCLTIKTSLKFFFYFLHFMWVSQKRLSYSGIYL